MKSYLFAPSLRLTVFCGILASILVSFGIWQLDRAAQKTLLQKAIEARTKMPTIENESLEALYSEGQISEQLLHRSLTLHGHFDQDQQILLENIVRKTVNGYYVYTPLILENGKAVLINRGWLKAGKTRADIPVIDTPENRVSISGRIAKPRSKPVMPGKLPPPDINGEKVWFYLDLDFIASKTQIEFLPFVVLQTNPVEDGLLREWPAFDGKTGMHIGYAIQWFVFSLAVLFAWASLSLRKRPSSPSKHNNVSGAANNA